MFLHVCEFVCMCVLSAACTFGAVAAKQSGVSVDPSVLAVGVMYVIQLAGLFQWTVRQR